MPSIESIYLLASISAVIAMFPQIKRLVITKQSDELSITTWIAWALYQASALAYSIKLAAVPYMVANIAWLMFYAVMLTLIIKYRPRPVPVEILVNKNKKVEEI